MIGALPLRAALAALALAAFAAFTLPGTRAGLAAALVAVAVIAVAASTGRRADRALLMTALVLALVPLFRDAGWVVTVDLIAAVVLSVFAVARAERWRTMAAALGRAALFTVPAVPALIVPVARALDRGRARRALPFVRGFALGGILLVVFGTLFMSADAAFAEVVQKTLVPQWSIDRLPARVALFALVGATGGALALLALRPLPEPATRVLTARLQPPEWITALALLDLLFAGFVGVQIAVLFGGHDHVLKTAGLTYAQYARQGFVELIVAAALTLGVAAIAARHAAREHPTQRRALQLLVGILFALTLVVLASALRRLGLYEQTFGFTRLRLFAHGTILWLGALFLLVGAASVLGQSARLPRLAVAMTALALIAATAANPDGLIAARNVHRFEQTGRIDAGYLSHLSADAVPRLAALPPKLRNCVLARATCSPACRPPPVPAEMAPCAISQQGSGSSRASCTS